MSPANLQEADGTRRPPAIARFFILNTLFAILFSLLLVVGGVLGYFSLVKQSNPDINIAVATITTTWPGADPQTIEQQVTDIIETEISSVENIREVRSASYTGFSVVNVEFTSEADVDRSIQELRDAVSQAEAELPTEAEQPVVEQVSIDDAPILTLALFGTLDPVVISRAAERIEDELEQVTGVSEVNLGGAREEVIQVQMDPYRLATLGISPTTIANRIRSANQDVPLDEIESDVIGTQVRLYGRFRTVEDLQQLPIARLSGRVVRLNEVASVNRALEEEETRAFISVDGASYEPVVSVGIVKVPGQDSIAVIDRVLDTMEQLKQNPNVWVYGLDYRIIADESDVIWEELGNLGICGLIKSPFLGGEAGEARLPSQKWGLYFLASPLFVNGLQAMAAVFVILFIALSWREALIAGLSIPLTFLGTLAVLWLTGQTLNIMVLIGMVLALGILVDVFILMMEGMHAAIFVKGLPFNEAALSTVKSYAPPAFAGQLTTILALAPLLAITGTLGKFIRLLPYTAITCLLLSFAIAILVDIPLSRYLLQGVRGTDQQSRIDRFSEHVSQRFARWSLNHTVRRKRLALAWLLGALTLFACAILAFMQVPTEFFPESDQRNFSVNVELPPTTTLESSQAVADDLGEILQEKDYLASVIKYVGQRSSLVASGELQPTEGSYLIGFSGVFTPQDERDQASFEYLDALRPELEAAVNQYPGASLVINAQQAANAEDPIQIELQGRDITRLRQISQAVQAELRQIPGAIDVRDNLGALQPDLRLVPQREALSFYQLTAEELAAQASYYTRAIDVGDFAIGGNDEDLEIRLSTAWASQNGRVGAPTRRDELLAVRFFTNNPEQPVVAASAVIEPMQSEAPLSITHRDGERTVTVLAKNEGRTVGQILADLEPRLNTLAQSWEAGYGYSFGGETEDQAETFGSAGQALGLAIFLVFAVLVVQLGSFRQPLIVLLAIPLGLMGTLGGFFLVGLRFSFTAFIGIIALVGVVVNDAIVMVDTMNTYQQEGMRVRVAAANGVSDRLRPIITTTITTIIGLIPLALSDPTWLPLCSAIIFGLLTGSLGALFVVPAAYLLLTPKTANPPSEDHLTSTPEEPRKLVRG